MKYPITILLILAVSVQTFSKCLLIVGYEINKDYISKNLCVNRGKPSCCCRGKCYLGKKLTADEDQQQSPGKSGQREEPQLQWFPAHFIETGCLLTPGISSNYSLYVVGKPQEFRRSFFQPPRSYYHV